MSYIGAQAAPVATAVGNNAVETQDIQDGAITTAKLANNAVTSTKLSADAVPNPVAMALIFGS